MAPCRFQKFLKSGEFTDVEFLVLPETFPVSRSFRAHKQFLAMSNEVFAAMFFGNLPEKEQVIITDIHPDGFACMLRYFYGGRLRFRTVDEALYTSTAAEKYMIPDLKRICSEYIVSHVNARNVCRLVDYASISDGGHVHEAVVSILQNNAVAVVNSDSFIDALQSTIEYVLMNIRGVPESRRARLARMGKGSSHQELDAVQGGRRPDNFPSPGYEVHLDTLLTARSFSGHDSTGVRSWAGDLEHF